MSQPKWKLVANLGDVSWLEHGGIFVYKDETEVYDPELEILWKHPEISNCYYSDRFVMEKCFYEKNILSDNEYHKDFPAWFADDINSICDLMDLDPDQFIKDICSDDILLRAWSWYAVYSHWGIDNLSGDSEELTGFEASNRFRHDMAKLDKELPISQF